MLVTEPDRESTLHCTVVPLFTDVAGTVRVDCTVPDDDDTVWSVIPRAVTLVSVASIPSTVHTMAIPLPLQWNRAFSPINALTDTGLSAIASAINTEERTR